MPPVTKTGGIFIASSKSNNPIYHAGSDAVHDHRAGDGEYSAAHAQDEAFCWCQVGRSVFCRNGSIPFDIAQIIGIYAKSAMWYNEIKG